MTNTIPTVRLSGPAELAAAIPRILGFHPSPGDLVIVCMHNGRVGLSARVALPEDQDNWDGVAAALASAYRQDEASTAVVVVYTRNRLVATVVSNLLDAQRVDVRETVLVEDGRAWSLTNCQAGDCVEGHRVETTPLDVAMVTQGQVVASSRADLKGRVAWSGDVKPEHGGDQLIRDGWLAAVCTTHDRDDALAGLAARSLEQLRQDVDGLCLTARYTPPWSPSRDAVLSTLAVAAYLRGDGALANVALAEASPNYSLAVLLRHALAATLPPKVVRDLLRQAAALSGGE